MKAEDFTTSHLLAPMTMEIIIQVMGHSIHPPIPISEYLVIVGPLTRAITVYMPVTFLLTRIMESLATVQITQITHMVIPVATMVAIGTTATVDTGEPTSKHF